MATAGALSYRCTGTCNIFTCKTLTSTLYTCHKSLQVSLPNSLRTCTIRVSNGRRNRGVSVVTRAGPSNTQYIFAFVFPLSLLAITIFTAFRIGDKLDQKFLEELAMNEAIREAEEENDDATEPVILRKEEPALPRSRNRPKREV